MIAAETPNSIEMAAASAFSYAQAAKGQGGPPSNTSSNPPSQTQSSQPDSAVTKASSVAENTIEAPDTTPTPDARSVVPDKQDVDSAPRSESDVHSETVPRPSESRRDDEVSRLDRPWRRNDKGTRSSSATTRSVDEQDSRKPRKGKKSKPTDKQSGDQASTSEKDQEPEPEAPKIELSEAPIPSVNPWHTRSSITSTSPSVEASNGLPDQAVESQKPGKPADGPSSVSANPPTNGVKPSRKTGDAARPERNGSRGSRLADKETRDGKTEVPPPVGDASSWPTPETAIKKEAKKTTDKPDTKDIQDDGSQGKHRKDKWVTYDYVPTVNFETQLPQLRGSKPRGGGPRGANGGRAAAGAQAGDKTAPAAPVTKAGESKDRPREMTNGANGTAPAPTAGKRASVDVAREPRKPAAHTNADQPKEHPSTEQGKAARDRPEGRGERGRGGYRGRGGHHSMNSHSQHQHVPASMGPPFPATGSMPLRPQGPYSPPPRQNSHGPMYMAPPQRGGRGGRNGAGANFHRMSLPNGRVPPVQTHFGPYEYPMAPMSAMPFQSPPYWENAAVLPVLKAQIEYYFSIENLCKDMYLRSHMDSQGFVPLHFVAAFTRVRNLSNDMGLVRAACEESNELDYVVGEDEVERLRRRDTWESWVLAYKEREEPARNEGPAHLSYKSSRYHYGHQFNGMAAPYGVASPPAYSGYEQQPFQQFAEEQQNGYRVNGAVNGYGHGHGSTQLSAEVPDFSPSGSFMIGGPDKFGATGANASVPPAAEKGANVHVSAALDALNGNGDGQSTQELANGVHSDAQDVAQS